MPLNAIGICLCALGPQVAELGAEQFLRLARQDLGGVPVVLHDAPVVVEAENAGTNRGGQGRGRMLGVGALQGRIQLVE
jgi:hypothetical protein